MNSIKTSILIISILILGTLNSFSGDFPISETDSNENVSLFAFFDLRDRESLVQVTNTDINNARLHIQIFDVSNLCNENNFFDIYTPNDTHVYNMKEILTNDGNPSGVALPDGAYGIVAISVLDQFNQFNFESGFIIGNFRIIDNAGYEYRTNMGALASNQNGNNGNYFFNFNQNSDITFSEVVGINLVSSFQNGIQEWNASDIINTFVVLDVDIIDNNEVLLSCRDVIFACIEPDNPLADELFSQVGDDDDDDDDELNESLRFSGTNGASVASFEYGVNNTLPHTKGGELLCPGNVIGEGLVKMRLQGSATPDERIGDRFLIFYGGLNNGNGRGSMDSLWEGSRLVGEIEI